MTWEKDTKIFRFLAGKRVCNSAIKWNIGGGGDLGGKVWILEVQSVRFQGHPNEVGSHGLPSEGVHLAAADESGME